MRILGLGLPRSGTGFLSQFLSDVSGNPVGHERWEKGGIVDWQLSFDYGWDEKPFGQQVFGSRLIDDFDFVVVCKRHPMKMLDSFYRRVTHNRRASDFIERYRKQLVYPNDYLVALEQMHAVRKSIFELLKGRRHYEVRIDNNGDVIQFASYVFKTDMQVSYRAFDKHCRYNATNERLQNIMDIDKFTDAVCRSTNYMRLQQWYDEGSRWVS